MGWHVAWADPDYTVLTPHAAPAAGVNAAIALHDQTVYGNDYDEIALSDRRLNSSKLSNAAAAGMPSQERPANGHHDVRVRLNAEPGSRHLRSSERR